MCGIIGYIGSEDVREVLLDALELLEYRGYDSAGIALRDERAGKQKSANVPEESVICGRSARRKKWCHSAESVIRDGRRMAV